MSADILIEDHGDIVGLRPTHARAERWLKENTCEEWLGSLLICEPRHVHEIIRSAAEDGLVTQIVPQAA